MGKVFWHRTFLLKVRLTQVLNTHDEGFDTVAHKTMELTDEEIASNAFLDLQR